MEAMESMEAMVMDTDTAAWAIMEAMDTARGLLMLSPGQADADAASLVLDKLSLPECHGNVLLQPRVKETQRPDLFGPHTHTHRL